MIYENAAEERGIDQGLIQWATVILFRTAFLLADFLRFDPYTWIFRPISTSLQPYLAFLSSLCFASRAYSVLYQFSPSFALTLWYDIVEASEMHSRQWYRLTCERLHIIRSTEHWTELNLRDPHAVTIPRRAVWVNGPPLNGRIEHCGHFNGIAFLWTQRWKTCMPMMVHRCRCDKCFSAVHRSTSNEQWPSSASPSPQLTNACEHAHAYQHCTNTFWNALAR